MIIIYGPTGSGKTEFADQLSSQIPSEIINMDMGQCYQPLTIGTAKPDWQKSSIIQHGFDIVDEPVNYTVGQYRTFVQALIDGIKKRGKIPVLVGGSGFYLKSLLYPPITLSKQEPVLKDYPEPSLRWNLLNDIDPVRAAQIHPHDTYRVTRALDIWFESGVKPSQCTPLFNPIDSFLIINITRDRIDLYDRINKRTELMIATGWLDEVSQLINTPWEPFLHEKKIIGYNEILLYLTHKSFLSQKKLIDEIQKKTRNYAKRQLIFAAGLERDICRSLEGSSCISNWLTLSLTSQPFELYIKQVLNHPYIIMKSANNECAIKQTQSRYK